jgi:hypothetical protein
MRALSESFAVCRKSEAYPCREKWREISRRLSAFWLPNALLTANFVTIQQTFVAIEHFWETTGGMMM